MDRIAYLVVVSGPEMLGNNNAGSAGEPQKADDHVDDRTDRTDRRKSFIADEVADDPCVDGIV